MHSGIIQEEKNQKALQHEVSVTLKLIQVYVTDKEGNPVTDLKKEDFTLWDNEEQQEITDFESHFFFLQKKEPEPAQAVKILEEAVPLSSPAPMNRKFFIFLDIQRNDPIGVIKSKRVVCYFVETQVQSGDEAGVFSFQPSAGFVLHQYLTTDMEKVLRAIKKARAIPGIDMFSMGTDGPSWGALAKPLSVFFYALEDLSVSLQYIPGIKNIVLFSRGAGVGAKQMFDLLGNRLASANCCVYTVDQERARLERLLLRCQSTENLN